MARTKGGRILATDNVASLAMTPFQQGFDAWLHDSNPCLAIPLHRRVTLRHGAIRYRFSGITPVLSVIVQSNYESLCVSADWKRRNWDALIDLECSARHVDGGYACSICEDDCSLLTDRKHKPLKVFASRQLLWEDHIFDPLHRWIERSLKGATHLRLMRWNHGATAAELTSIASKVDKDSGPLFLEMQVGLVPLRQA